jgi:zinc transport system permease protein
MLFLHYALLGGILASIACGIIGPFVVVRRIGYISGGIAHTVLAGLGIAYFLGKSPIIGALITALIAALIIGGVSLKAKKYEDTIISVLWAMGMAIGIIFITKTPGFNVDLMSYLFGNILLISQQDLYLLAGLDVVIIVLMILVYKRLLAVCFDEEFARLRGLRVNFYFLLLLCLVALTVVSLMQVVGLILVIALLTIPAAIARQYVNSVAKMMFIAIVLGMIFTAAGLGISYQANLPSGATIILLAGIGFLLSTGLKKVAF